jgi:hypothetical protein
MACQPPTVAASTEDCPPQQAANSLIDPDGSPAIEEHLVALERARKVWDDPHALLTIAEVCPVLRCSYDTVSKKLKQGYLRGLPDKPIRIFAASLKEYLEAPLGKKPAVPPATEEARPAVVEVLPKPVTKPAKVRPAARGRSPSRVVLERPGQTRAATP